MLFNLHTHCNFCDGAGNPEEYVKQALAKGFSVLGFSCHGPAPFTTGWTMEYENTEDYLKTVDSLKTAYKQELQIYKGMEIDYFQGDTRQIFTKYELDYIIGSVHFINAEGENKYYSIDGSLEAFEQTLKMCSDSSIEKLVRRYYELLVEMLAKRRFDILGHLDLVKKNNFKNRFFNEQEKWYISLVKDVVEKIARYNVIVEINTGGIARGYMNEVYPSEWIIRECKKWEIPVTLSSDAHSPQDIDFYFAEAKKIIKSASYSEIWGIQDGKWVSIKI
ncbi:MAG: histidinol-phosphatase HisJ [Zhaonellaceae bacterium]|jgi:histidinol-phosphatase (PHP family)|nr:histidinol-phosphatase HisJ [Clostridia bacterium]